MSSQEVSPGKPASSENSFPFRNPPSVLGAYPSPTSSPTSPYSIAVQPAVTSDFKPSPPLSLPSVEPSSMRNPQEDTLWQTQYEAASITPQSLSYNPQLSRNYQPGFQDSYPMLASFGQQQNAPFVYNKTFSDCSTTLPDFRRPRTYPELDPSTLQAMSQTLSQPTHTPGSLQNVNGLLPLSPDRTGESIYRSKPGRESYYQLGTPSQLTCGPQMTRRPRFTPFVDMDPLVTHTTFYPKFDTIADTDMLDVDDCDDPQPSVEREDSEDKPYAQLIFDCLLCAPGYKRTLREIYDWFRKHTDRAKDSNAKGWQNSIRHNLSMNAAFVKDTPGNEKRNNVWKLSEEAIREGVVHSTTRYRIKPASKRRSRPPAPQRASSGAKGGMAARKASNLRRSERIERLRTHNGYDLLRPPQAPRSDGTLRHNEPPFSPDMHTYAYSPSLTPVGSSDASQSTNSPMSTDFGPFVASMSFEDYPQQHGFDYGSFHHMQDETVTDDVVRCAPVRPGESLFYDSPASSFTDPLTTPSSAFDDQMPYEFTDVFCSQNTWGDAD